MSNKGKESIYRIETIKSDGGYGEETATILKSSSDFEVAESSEYLVH
jgi:hypothetical protein